MNDVWQELLLYILIINKKDIYVVIVNLRLVELLNIWGPKEKDKINKGLDKKRRIKEVLKEVDI